MTDTTAITTTEHRALMAAAGARWLDYNRPGWANDINQDTLDMADGCNCILGQLNGDFWDAIEEWMPDAALLGETRLVAAYRLGFYYSGQAEETNEAYADLEAAWMHEIKVRRG